MPLKLKENIVELKKYWQIIYAVLLIVLIPVAIIANTVWVTKNFKDNIDFQLQTRATGIADVFNATMQRNFGDTVRLQEALESAAQHNDDIKLAEVLVRDGDAFKIVASLIPGHIGKTTTDIDNVLAWYQNAPIARARTPASFAADDPLVTRLFPNLQQRYWAVTQPMMNENGEKVGLLSMKISTEAVDSLVSRTLFRSYAMLFFAVIVVMLLLVANTRLFQYAVLAKKLKEVEQLKDEFISMASHELRTPITSLRGYLSMLSEGSLGELPGLAKEKVNMMLGSADRLNELVEDLLNVSRIEQGRLSINFEVVRVENIVEGVMAELDVQAKQKGLKFIYQRPSTPLPGMMLDPNRLKQVFVNIFGNAIKYTPKGSVTITTIYRPEDKKLEIKCADTGLGMTAKDREKLFTKFYRVKTKETEAIKGTGLGLWITKQLIELMDGEILVDSIKGVGTQMTLLFPVRDMKEMQELLSKQQERVKKEAEYSSTTRTA